MKSQDHFVIFDTEFTAWKGSNLRGWSESWEFKEVIQIAAIKIAFNPSGITILSTFNELVKPKRNPMLSDYIIELTGINQAMIDEMGVDFPSAMEQFHQFCLVGDLRCFAWGSDAKILQENCEINNMPMPAFSAGFYNLKQRAMELQLSGAELSSGELANHFDLPITGHQHNALYDVRSLAGALQSWLESGKLSADQL